MKLVLDTSIILKALIRNSKVRAALLSPNHQLFVPEYAVEETRRHFGLIMKKTGLSEDEVKLVSRRTSDQAACDSLKGYPG